MSRSHASTTPLSPQLSVYAALNLDVSDKARKWVAFAFHAVFPVALGYVSTQYLTRIGCIVWLWLRFVATFNPSECTKFYARLSMACVLIWDICTVPTPLSSLCTCILLVTCSYFIVECVNLTVDDIATMFRMCISEPLEKALNE